MWILFSNVNKLRKRENVLEASCVFELCMNTWDFSVVVKVLSLLQAYIDKTWISNKMLNIPTFNGRKSYHPDLQINKGQLDRIINAAYYQLIKKKKKKTTLPIESYTQKKKKKLF